MRFLDTVRRAKEYLQEQERVSLRALRREFELEDDALEELVEELVDVQRVAVRDGKVLAWANAPRAVEPAPSASSAPERAPEPRDAERRQLTVMFCDLVESTALSQRLDAERLREVVRAYQESAASVIERYDGHIAQYLGDGLLVYFGFPRAHEDDAARAVRAGRELLGALDTLNETVESEHGVRLAVRVGIHTGPVVVGEMGGGGRSETLALGETTNIAARLESAAESGSVVVSGATLRLVPGLFVTRDLGTPPLKGIEEPIRAHAVLRTTGVRSRLDVDPTRLTPLVGRDQELGLLVERWEQVEEGEGQAVLISGEAGLGKSRLLQAFRERLARQPHGWLECGCSPYTQESAFHPLIELLDQGLGFRPGDDAAARLGRVENGVRAAGLSLSEVVPLIAPLLSIPLRDPYAPLQLSPEFQRQRTIEALVAWALGLAEEQPLVMLVEDLHCCDPSTVEFLGLLLEQCPTTKVLTLLTFRPDFEPPWASRSYLTHLEVKRLSRRQATKMVAGMTPDVPLPDDLIERIVGRADGIPIFVEELTKMVLESDLIVARDGRYALTRPLTDLAIPDTLQDSLMARLDRLSQGKKVAQLGAVLGREFSYDLLRAVAAEADLELHAGLDQLVKAELLYQRGAPPQANFTFKHSMIQETAYGSLLTNVRQDLHSRIAKVLEERFPERVEAEPELIARHHAEAGQAEPAIAHYRKAGERATERSANAEAIGQLGRALELLATTPETPERDRQELGLQMAIAAPLMSSVGFGHPDCERAYERARELASRIGEVRELPRVLMGLASSSSMKGDLATSAELANESLRAAERTGDTADLVMAHSAVLYPFFWQGDYARALEHADRVMALYDPDEHAFLAHAVGNDRGVNAACYAAPSHWVLGHPDRALGTISHAIALSEQIDHPYSLANSIMFAAAVHLLRREPELTLERAERAVDLAERVGFATVVGAGRALLGWALTHLGKAEEGIAQVQAGLAELARIGTGVGAPMFLAFVAEASWKAGRRDDALALLDVASARSEAQGQHFWDAEVLRLRGEMLLDRGAYDLDEAEELLQRALDVARRQGARSFELRTVTRIARLWQDRGQREEARALLAPVYGEFSEGLDTPDLEDARTLVTELS